MTPFASHQEWLAAAPPLTYSILAAKAIFSTALLALIGFVLLLSLRRRSIAVFARDGSSVDLQAPLVRFRNAIPVIAFKLSILLGIYIDQIAHAWPDFPAWATCWWIRAVASLWFVCGLPSIYRVVVKLRTSQEWHDAADDAQVRINRESERRLWAEQDAREKGAELDTLRWSAGFKKEFDALIQRIDAMLAGGAAK